MGIKSGFLFVSHTSLTWPVVMCDAYHELAQASATLPPEVVDMDQAAQYVSQCASSVVECRRRRVPSRFKVAGVRCQTLPKDSVGRCSLSKLSASHARGVRWHLAQECLKSFHQFASGRRVSQNVGSGRGLVRRRGSNPASPR